MCYSESERREPNFNSHSLVELGKGERTEDPWGTHISAVHTHDRPVMIRHLFAAMLGLELQYPEGQREYKSNAQRAQGFSLQLLMAWRKTLIVIKQNCCNFTCSLNKEIIRGLF